MFSVVLINVCRLGRTRPITLNLSVWRGKVGANTWSYCTTETAKRNITSSGLEMILVCVCLWEGRVKML